MYWKQFGGKSFLSYVSLTTDEIVTTALALEEIIITYNTKTNTAIEVTQVSLRSNTNCRITQVFILKSFVLSDKSYKLAYMYWKQFGGKSFLSSSKR